MKKLNTFFKKNTNNILAILGGLPLVMLIIFMIYTLFTEGLPKDLKAIINRIDLFSVFVGIIIAFGIQAFVDMRKGDKKDNDKI